MDTKYIIFDMDGLMIDSEKLSFDIIKSILHEHGYNLSLEFYAKTIGVSREHSEQLFTQSFPGIDGKRDVYGAFFERYFKAVEDGKLAAKPGLIQLLNELDKRGIKRAVASSNDKSIVEASLKSIGVYNRIDAIVYSELVERVKPFPDLFLKAAKTLGGKPEECLILEDSQAGVEAALSAHIPVIIIPDMIPPSEAMLKGCLRRYDSLYDVIEYIYANDIPTDASNY